MGGEPATLGMKEEYLLLDVESDGAPSSGRHAVPVSQDGHHHSMRRMGGRWWTSS